MNGSEHLPHTDEAAERAFEELEILAHEASQAKGRAAALTHSRKAILAQEMQLAQKKGHDSIGAQEREARASGRYEQWLKDYEEAVAEAEMLRLKVETRRMRFEYWRTRRADRRAEMNYR